MGYYADFRTCIPNSGLTDTYIARQRIEHRDRIGHEKRAPYSYMLKRGVDFVFGRKFYLEREYRMVFFVRDESLSLHAELITYDRELLSQLARRMGSRIRFVRFEKYLDDYIAQRLDVAPLEQVRSDYEEFKEFYFDHNDDPARELVFLRRLSES